MGSLLDNLFENAIAGCQDLPKSQRQIQFRSYVKNNHLIIIIENPLLIPLQMQNNIYLSTKHKGYGLGIQSIQNIVHSLKGDITIVDKPPLFQIKIIIWEVKKVKSKDM